MEESIDIVNANFYYFFQQNSLYAISKVYRTLSCKDIGIRKSEFVAKAFFLKSEKNDHISFPFNAFQVLKKRITQDLKSLETLK